MRTILSRTSDERRRIDQFRKRLGKTIRRWRKKHDLTREDVAFGLEPRVSVSTVRRWEEGAADLRVFQLEALDQIKPGLVEMVFGRVT